MTGRVTSRVLIGRSHERARLDAALEEARTGRLVTVFVAGEAGIGKTRLVSEFTGDVTGELTLLAGACIDERVPYSPIADALRSLVRGGWDAHTRPGQDWHALATLLPELGTTPGEAGSPGRLHAAFVALLEELTRQRAAVVVVEDLHWSDASTRNLLMYTMRAARDHPVLFIGTYRSDDLTMRHPLRQFLAEAARLPYTEIVELDRLGTSDIAELVADISGSRPPPELVDEVYARADGNPFLVEEVIAAGADPGTRRLPQRLQDILLARTASLTPEAAEVLRATAVGGQRVDDRLLRRVCSLAPGVLDNALRELHDAHLLAPDLDGRGYVFRHALTAEAVYEDTLPGERVRLHADFARAIGDEPELASVGEALAAVECAQHWHRARQGTDALRAWVDAGTAAEGVYAYPEALGAYENALELWPTIEAPETVTGVDEVEVLRRGAEVAYRGGMPDRAVALARDAIARLDERRDALRAAALAERLGRYSWASGRAREALSYYERSVLLAPQEPPTPERARALAGHAQILMLQWFDAEAARRAQQAIDVARNVGAGAVEAHALNTLAVGLTALGDEEAALAAMAASARLTEQVGDDDNIGRLAINRSDMLLSFGRAEEAAAVARDARPTLRDIGLAPSVAAYVAMNHADALIHLGRWDEARVLLDETIGRAQSGVWRAGPLRARAWLNWLTGHLDDAESDLVEVERLTPELSEGQLLAPQAQVAAAIAIQTEHWRAAVDVTGDALASIALDGDEPVVHWQAMTAAWFGLWAVAESVGEGGAVDADWLTPHLAVFIHVLDVAASRPVERQTARNRALLALCHAELKRVDRSATSDDWQHAVADLEELGAVAERAYARARLAAATLAEGGDRRAAAAAIDEAIDLFAAATESPIRALAETVARRARLRVGDHRSEKGGAPAPSPANRFGLTERELEVFALLGEARTNREIGEALFISPKTVSVHVTSVMRKLGVHRRADATRLARRGVDVGR